MFQFSELLLRIRKNFEEVQKYFFMNDLQGLGKELMGRLAHELPRTAH